MVSKPPSSWCHKRLEYRNANFVYWLGIQQLLWIFFYFLKRKRKHQEYLSLHSYRDALWGYSSKVAIYKAIREVSSEVNPTDTLILGCQYSELWQSKYLLFKPLRPCYSIMTTWADTFCDSYATQTIEYIFHQGNSYDSGKFIVSWALRDISE